MLSDSQSGVGTARICHFYDGTSATELVTDWVEGESFRVELSDFTMPLVIHAEAEMRVKVFNHVLLVAIHPSGEDQHQELQLRSVH